MGGGDTLESKVLCQTSKAFLITYKLPPQNRALKNTRFKLLQQLGGGELH